MPLFKLSFIEERVVAQDAQEAWEKRGYVQDGTDALYCELLPEPMATLDFTTEQIYFLHTTMQHRGPSNSGIREEIQSKLHDALLQLSVQKVMVQWGTPRNAAIRDPLTPAEQERDAEADAERNWTP